MLNLRVMSNPLTYLLVLWAASLSLSEFVYLTDVGSPGATYPLTDIYDGGANPNMMGQVNAIGMRQQYLLGSYLRADYIHKAELIPQKYNPKNIQIFVSSQDRTSDSALCRLYGLFPMQKGWKIPTQVTPDKLDPPYETDAFQISSENEDYALVNGFTPAAITQLENVLNSACPNKGILQTKRLQQIARNLTIFAAQHSIFMAEAKVAFNLSVLQINLASFVDLYHTVLSDLTLGKQLPPSFGDYGLKSLKFISDYYTSILHSGSYGKTISTPILSAIKNKMMQERAGTLSPKKWSVYFPREDMLASMLTLLNLTSPECLNERWKNGTVSSLNCVEPPSFSSNLLIELHRDDSFEFQIKIKYNGDYVYLCEKRLYECNYEDFWGRVAVEMADYHQNCQTESDDSSWLNQI